MGTQKIQRSKKKTLKPRREQSKTSKRKSQNETDKPRALSQPLWWVRGVMLQQKGHALACTSATFHTMCSRAELIRSDSASIKINRGFNVCHCTRP